MTSDPKTIEISLDLRGHECPVPVILLDRLAKAIGQKFVARIQLQCDDPLVHVDVTNWCRRWGVTLTGSRIDGIWKAEINLNE